ncbi:type II toxin-antitoxin system death-on-curing family toxin [Saxibacter everestensis]|uniref:Type II toxin-antitoxin system death-on-curing family toxin n=1 Tax=Saxibacter everestensis TaxID=2909229 RepID=A0ABY8QXV2_9MICO|nr:type II toxin-antitoxin system death-on-curing family toxin [Brevibacteriaceae bacterium ZFBP1038]
MKYLRTEELLVIATRLGVAQVRDIGLLDSAAFRPQSVLFGEAAYPTIEAKAAALFESLVRNHPLVDGNKRLAWTGTKLFLVLNGYGLSSAEDDAYDFVISAAAGELSFDEIARWYRDHLTG